MSIKDILLEGLGEASALFMSQECKGTEIVMPTEEIKEISNKILTDSLAFMENHYWNSLEKDKNLIISHIKSMMDRVG